MVAPNRTRWSGLEGLCVLLRRIAYPRCGFEMEEYFGRGKADASIICNSMLQFLFNRWNRLFVDLSEHTRPGRWLTLERLHEAATAVHEIGPFEHIWAFIDGTARPIARPTRGQRIWYSGHKRRHVQKFQAIMAAHGIVVHLYGPVEGQRHDSAMLRMSGVMHQLEELPARGPNPGDVFALYGDSRYPLKLSLQVPFPGANVTEAQREHNAQMSSCRICVEWSFAEIRSKFAFQDLKDNQRLLLQPVGLYYIIAALFVNCHTCLYGNETSSHFKLTPPPPPPPWRTILCELKVCVPCSVQCVMLCAVITPLF